jgi:hypothetical protein
MSPQDLVRFLECRRFPLTMESELHAAIVGEFQAAGVAFEREVMLSHGDRVDIMVGEDDEVVAEALAIARRHGLKITSQPCKGGTVKCRFYDFSAGRSGKWGRNTLKRAFIALGLRNNKHIPQIYKTSSVQERRELLAGLIDSDGHVYSGNAIGSAEFTNRNERLAHDVAFIARSIGMAASVRSETRRRGYGPQPTTAYRVTISGDLTQIPTRVQRKKARPRAGQKNVLHTGFEIEAIGDGEFFGFEVDGDNLFLLRDFTVVHNCYQIWLDDLGAYRPVMFTGSESPKQKDQAKHDFISGKTNLMFISLRSGEGLDGLQKRCSTVVFGELDWSPEVHKQVIGRLGREGQAAGEITAIFLVSNSGSDPVIQGVLGLKQSQSRGVMDPSLGVEVVHTDITRLKSLAKSYLKRR